MTEITETCDGSHHTALSAALLMKEPILIAVQKSGSGKLLYSLQTVACSEPLANQTNDHYESFSSGLAAISWKFWSETNFALFSGLRVPRPMIGSGFAPTTSL
jgi:hypothetical protein